MQESLNSHPYRTDGLVVMTHETFRTPASPSLDNPRHGALRILGLIARTPIGQEWVASFLPFFQAGMIRIEPYPLDLLMRLQSVLEPGQPVGACFFPEGEKGRILIDFSSPIGVVAPFLLHEIVHALDPKIWEAAKTPMTDRERDQVMLEAETLAFEMQRLWVDQYSRQVPAYAEFLRLEYPRCRILHERLTKSSVADLYGFDTFNDEADEDDVA